MKHFIILLFFLATTCLQAQSSYEYVRYTALNYPVGAESYMLGKTGVNGLQTDLFSAYLNPALAGNLAAKTTYDAGYSFFEPFYPVVYRYTKTGSAFAGFPVNEILGTSVPIHLGLSYQYLFDTYHLLALTFEGGPEPLDFITPYSRIHAFTSGIAFDLPVKISAGLTFNHAQDHFEQNYYGNSYSFGLAAIVPISELFFPNFQIKQFENSALQPFSNLSFGYTRKNLDTKARSFTFNDNYIRMYPSVTYHAPATVSTGYGFDIGLNLKIRSDKLTFFKFYYSHEASDGLYYMQKDGTLKLQGIMGDINFVNNVLFAKGNKSVEERLGYSFSFFETISFNYGKVEHAYGSGEYEKTRGITFTTKGVKKILTHFTKQEVGTGPLGEIFRSLDISYSYGYARQELPNSYYFYPKGYVDRNYYSIMLTWHSGL